MHKNIRILMTSCGGLVFPGMVECLRVEKEYAFHIVGVDMDSNAVGAHFVDKFYTVPSGVDPSYPWKIIEIAQKENIHVILPLSDEELISLSKYRDEISGKGIVLLCSEFKAVETASDKGKMLNFLKERNVPVPEFYVPNSLEELDEAVESLGYPGKEIVLKPTKSRGGRGFWILSEKYEGPQLILGSQYLQHLPYPVIRSFFCEPASFPEIIVMQYLRGPDFNVDVLSWQGEILYCIPMQRLVPDAGPVQVGRIVQDHSIDEMVKQIVAAFGFSYNINVELAYANKSEKGIPLVYEINPRASGPIAANRKAGVNLLLNGILLSLGYRFPKKLTYKEIMMQRCWREVYS